MTKRTIFGLLALCALAAAPTAIAYPPATLTSTQTSIAVASLDCGTSYEVRVREWRSGAWRDANTYTRATQACAAPTPTPTPSPTPSPPPSIGFPDASNTGVPDGTPLTVVNGNLTVNTSGAVVDGQDVRGCVIVNASNVTIRNTRIACAESSVLWSGSTGLVVQDSEVSCTGGSGTTAVTPQNYTLTRVEVTGCENSTWAERNVVIQDSFIHDLVHYDPIRDPHTDGVQMPSGASNVTIQHSTVFGQYANNDDFGNSAITMGGSMSNIVVRDNELAGGGYTLRCNDAGGTSSMTITGNRFSTVLVSTVGGFGPTDGGCRSHSSVYSDNVYLDGPRQGQPVE